MRHLNRPRAGVDALTTADFSSGRFLPHGLVNVRYSDDILRVEARGPVNLELMQALGQLRQTLVAQLRASARFAHMLIIRDSALMSPEAFAKYRQDRAAVYGSAIRYPRANAIVVGPEVEGWELMAPKISEIYLADGVPYRVFADEATACHWLQRQHARAGRQAEAQRRGH